MCGAKPSHTCVSLTKKKIVCVRTETADLEYLDHIKELPVYVANDCNRRANVYDVALLHQELFRFGAYCFDDGLR